MDSILLIGLEQSESDRICSNTDSSVIVYETLPRIQVERGKLFVERPNIYGALTPISKVIFHGIFEDDFSLICGLALWGGPCLPNAKAMMDCRLKLPCLVRSLGITRFGKMERGFSDRRLTVKAQTGQETVVKWGDWHCGENKQKFQDSYVCEVPTIVEPFIAGESVRIVLIGEQAWQIYLEGETWLKSLHHKDAHFMPIDPDLLEDARNLKKQLGLEIAGIDYIISRDGSKYLLEVNHIPNVTRFEEIREAYIAFAIDWIHKG